MSQKVVEAGASQGDPKKPRKNDMLVQEENQDSYLIAAMTFIIGIHTQKDRSAINTRKNQKIIQQRPFVRRESRDIFMIEGKISVIN